MLIYSLKVCQFPKTAILSLNLDISIRPIPKQYLNSKFGTSDLRLFTWNAAIDRFV